MLGQDTTTAAAGSLDATLNSTNYAFLGELEATNGGAVAAEAAQFVISNIGFNIVRMDMPSYWYEAFPYSPELAPDIELFKTVDIVSLLATWNVPIQ